MADLPAGTVTFCFTDIEGSTRLFQELGERYPPLLERHNRLLRQAFERHNGVEVKTEGDAFFVAFSSAQDAVAAAVDGQLLLANGDWPDAQPKVRVGLHAGEAYPVDGDYVALAVHQAARVAGAGHGGQIVVSSAVVDEIGESAPVTPLGTYALKDFDEPSLLFQVVADGLESEFPALRVPPAAKHNLPRFTTSFVGRDAERTTLRQLVTKRPLTTILGPGGTGKTRLACELLAGVASERRDGVRVALLAGVARPTEALAAVADAVSARGGSSPVEAIADRLAGSDMILLLDNCEHVLDEMRELCRCLLQRAPDVHIVTTSRRPLGLDGEERFALQPLSLPDSGGSTSDAVDLFTERATAVRPGFDAREEGERLAAVCARLDGLPLAIELAAARLRSLSLRQLDERLADALALLRSTDAGRDRRQQTVRSLIEWSTDLLDPEESATFRRCAVFHGGFTLEAAESVLGSSIDVIDVIDALTALVDHSLLLLTGDEERPRYRMLVLVRDVALERLRSAGEFDAVSGCHVAWLAEVAQAGPLPADEWDNAAAAIDWAIANGLHEEAAVIIQSSCWEWQRSGRSVERLLSWIEAVASEVNEERRLHLLHAGFRFAFDASAYERAERYLAALDESPYAHLTTLLRAELATVRGDFESAVSLATEVAESAAAVNDHRVNALNILGGVAFFRHQWHEARRHYMSALEVGEVGSYRAMLTTNIAEVGVIGGLPDAEASCLAAIAESEAAGFHFYKGAGHELLALHLFAAGDFDRAAEEVQRSVEIFSAIDHVANVLDALGLLARIELARDDRRAAMSALRRALDLLDRRGLAPPRGVLLASARYLSTARSPAAASLEVAWTAGDTPAISTAYDVTHDCVVAELPSAPPEAEVPTVERLRTLLSIRAAG